MAAPARVELATMRLTTARSAIELWSNKFPCVQGWEWQASNLPLQGFNLTLIQLSYIPLQAEAKRIELLTV